MLHNASSSEYLDRQKKNQVISEKEIAEALEANEEAVLKKVISLRSCFD